MPRKRQIRQEKIAKYIFVEGKSEEKYFEILRQNEYIPNLQVFFIGAHATSLWYKSVKKMENHPKLNRKNADIYLIFDKDHLTEEEYNEIFELSKKEKFMIGFSNSAFEVWLLAHFEDLNSGFTSTEQLEAKLSVHLESSNKKLKYKKADTKQLEKIVPNYQNAIKNTAKINQEDFSQQCTTVGAVILDVLKQTDN